jgi:hypothetical protein
MSPSPVTRTGVKQQMAALIEPHIPTLEHLFPSMTRSRSDFRSAHLYQIIGLGRFLEHLSEKGFGLVAIPFSIPNGFTHNITTLINQKRRRKRPCVVKFERFCVLV